VARTVELFQERVRRRHSSQPGPDRETRRNFVEAFKFVTTIEVIVLSENRREFR
jgi:hypothetical protein